MPIATKKPDVEVNKAPLPVGDVISKNQAVMTAYVDTAVRPPESLVLYMEGMPWVVNYYSQLVDRHDDIREIDTTQNAALQQYRKLIGMELRVTSELATNFDAETGRNDVTGTAVVFGSIPNTYDYFVTDAGMKGQGLFMITSSTRKTYNNGSVYEVDYILVGYTDAGTAMDRFTALEDRSVKEYHFLKDKIQLGQDPLLTTKQHGDVNFLKEQYRSISRAFLQMFISHHDRLLIVPGTDHTYDSRAANFVRATFDGDLPGVLNAHWVSHDRDPFLSLASLYTAILHRDPSVLFLCPPKVVKVSRGQFKQNSFMTSTNCWKVDGYIYPDLQSAIQIYPQFSGTPALLSVSNVMQAEASAVCNMVTNYGDRQIPLIKPVHRGSCYVLSQDFYEQKGSELSLLEILVMDYMAKKPLNTDHLLLLLSHWQQFNLMEKFYYTPILLVLIKDACSWYY